MLALISQSLGGARLGNPNPALYNLYQPSGPSGPISTAFNDVGVGNNSVPCIVPYKGCEVLANGDLYLDGYNAVTGYDQATGLGSVNAANLLTAWPTAVFTPSSIPVFMLGTNQGNESSAPRTAAHGTLLDFQIDVSPVSGNMLGNVTLAS
jgi:hypothetical protein